jgi:hypothetical protein
MSSLAVPDYGPVVERARDAKGALRGPESADAVRVLEIAGELAFRGRAVDGKLAPLPGDEGLRVELGRLAELLGRRSARAIPLASVARAAFADLAGRSDHALERLTEADRQLSLLGY